MQSMGIWSPLRSSKTALSNTSNGACVFTLLAEGRDRAERAFVTNSESVVGIVKCESTFPSTHIGGSGANPVSNIFLRPISPAPLISQQIICPSHPLNSSLIDAQQNRLRFCSNRSVYSQHDALSLQVNG